MRLYYVLLLSKGERVALHVHIVNLRSLWLKRGTFLHWPNAAHLHKFVEAFRDRVVVAALIRWVLRLLVRFHGDGVLGWSLVHAEVHLLLLIDLSLVDLGWRFQATYTHNAWLRNGVLGFLLNLFGIVIGRSLLLVLILSHCELQFGLLGWQLLKWVVRRRQYL